MEPARQGRYRAKQREGFLHRAGWLGMALLAGALFFLIGGVISLLNGDLSVAIQGLIVSGLLIVGGLYVAVRRRR